jgi:carboxymethylenebutenolidase
VDALPAPGVLPDIQAAIDHAAVSGGKVGIVGFCWGGVLTWRTAFADQLSAAVPYYGERHHGPEDAPARQAARCCLHFNDSYIGWRGSL